MEFFTDQLQPKNKILGITMDFDVFMEISISFWVTTQKQKVNNFKIASNGMKFLRIVKKV